MDKRNLLILGAKGFGALGLFGTGMGCYILLSPGNSNEIKFWTHNDDNNIVKSSDITTAWTFVTHYPESNFFITCNKNATSVPTAGSVNALAAGGVNGGVQDAAPGVDGELGSPVGEVDGEKQKAVDESSSLNCRKYIESKAFGGHPIWVYQDQNDPKFSNAGGWHTYKFTYYKKEGEDGGGGTEENYYGLCAPNPDTADDFINNPCAQHNLPEGWNKSLIPHKQVSH